MGWDPSSFKSNVGISGDNVLESCDEDDNTDDVLVDCCGEAVKALMELVVDESNTSTDVAHWNLMVETGCTVVVVVDNERAKNVVPVSCEEVNEL